jgi:hypothetical protein
MKLGGLLQEREKLHQYVYEKREQSSRFGASQCQPLDVSFKFRTSSLISFHDCPINKNRANARRIDRRI